MIIKMILHTFLYTTDDCAVGTVRLGVMGEYVDAFLLKTLYLTMRGFLLYVIFRKIKLSNREVNPEVSGRLLRWYCPPRRDRRVCRRLSFENPSSNDEGFFVICNFNVIECCYNMRNVYLLDIHNILG